MLIAHISDTHFLTGGDRLAGRFDTTSAFHRLIDSLAQQPVQPDLILFSGDLCEDATRDAYAALGAALRDLGLPVSAVPGNHDARIVMRAELPDMVGLTDSGHLCLMDDRFPLAIIGLDTIVEGQPQGALCPSRLRWLADTLNTLADRPALMFMHHPPIPTGLQAMDAMGLAEGGDTLADLLRKHGKIEGILCGHVHRAIQGTFSGVPVRIAPSASHQIAFDLRPDIPYQLIAEPAQYMMHLWTPDGGLLSHTVPVSAPPI